ncbi:type I glyceraldehyde-3-phosphate dehydrogenase [Methanoregula sp.]|jgi:glyceraldehyde 3-phosphate dehydrogenase/glyceraldehyde-3-phosphate dehydrogenase (NAD(P))|uniref:type I glyceraldehyde-3-phosphate dehydrogenase n=1 Tax=Methanoregula sp. TaxID=2052170 RepID=UPI003C2A3282
MKNVAINGLGRIGRLALRQYIENPPQNIRLTTANASTPMEDLAYLMKYDSVHGKTPFPVSLGPDFLTLGSHRIDIVNSRDPALIPWKKHDIDIVLECTGVFTRRNDAAKHLQAGAEKVIISAPAADADATFVMGVNEKTFDPKKHHVVSNASCTTNSISPVAKVLNDAFGIEYLMMTTVHAYTSSQAIVDKAAHKKRRGRSAAVSIIPATTGAAEATVQTIPALKDKMHAIAIRVPVADGSITDIVAHLGRAVTPQDVNATLKKAAENELKGILEYCEDELVSADIIGNTHSAIVDATSTAVIGKNVVKVMVWYDNEWGYARRLLDLASYMAGRMESS